jgi:Predicted acyl-CoA transferases/carnitine dehydratase
VADFSRVLAGPMCTMLLADLGATVIKVERPGTGDDTRTWGPPFTEHGSTYYLSVNRNKRSITLDLTDEADRAAARALAERADVLVENFRTGVLDRLGFGYDELSAANPGLVYCSVTGYGSGAGAQLPGYDFVIQAVGGLMSITGPVDGPPSKVGVAVVDVITGLHAAVGILAALRERDHSGRGQRVEVNLLSSLIAGLVNVSSAYLHTGEEQGLVGNSHPSITPYESVRTADRPLVLAVGNDRQFTALCRVLGLPELPTDPRFATNSDRVAHRSELIELLERRLTTRDAAGWTAELSKAGVPCGPVNGLEGAFALARELGLEPSVAVTHPETGRTVPQVANPVRLSRTPVSYHRPPPTLGADTTDVLDWLRGIAGSPEPGGTGAQNQP